MRKADDPAYSDCVWGDQPDDYAIRGDDAHVWRIDLRPEKHDLDGLRRLLSEDEQQRADRFLRVEHRQRFTVGRGVLRTLLAAYTGGDAQAIHFDYNEFAKPELTSIDNPDKIAFNVSHTGSHAVVVIGQHPSVGIDIERYREKLELQKLAHRYFAPTEVETLMALPDDRREEAFYRCWSSKEAFIKVIGQGLSIGLNKFEVEVNPDCEVSIVKVPESLLPQGPWAFAELPMGAGLSGVLAVEGALENLCLFQHRD